MDPVDWQIFCAACRGMWDVMVRDRNERKAAQAVAEVMAHIDDRVRMDGMRAAVRKDYA